MRFVVNDIAANSGGVLTVLKDFYQYLKNYDTENEWFFLLGGDFLEPTERIHIIKLPEVKNSKIKRLIFDYITGRKLINELNPDCVFSLQNTITYGVKCPQVVYEHQVLPFQDEKKFSFLKSNERTMAVYQYLIGSVVLSSAKHADKVIVQTESMREVVSKKCGIDKNKIVKIAPNVESLEKYRIKTERKNNKFFFPTSTAPYKNIQCIYDACKLLEHKNLDFSVEITVPDGQPQKNIKYIGQISRQEVFEKFCESSLIFPSYLESFGYPLVEAAQMGATVFASDRAFSKEVLDGYPNAFFFDPFNPSELANLIEKNIKGEMKTQDTYTTINSSYNSWSVVVEELIKSAKEG